VVPPRSNRVSRAPPYSRTPVHPYPYRAVTVCGAPFQALPVREQRPLAWSAFARRYLRSRACCPFLRLLRCFSSPGAAIDSPHDTACAVGCPIRTSEDHRALAPPLGFSQRATSFIASRCQGIHQMPFSCCARAQPQAREVQRSDGREQMTDIPAGLLAPWNRCAGIAPAAARASAARIPMLQARPRPERRWPDLLHGHDSLHDVNRTEDRDQRTDQTVRRAILRHNSSGPHAKKTRQGTSVPRVEARGQALRSPSSGI
jgi:hypothetical protein